MLLPVTSCRNTTSAPTARTASRNSGRMNLRLKKVNPLWMLTVRTLKENDESGLGAASAVCESAATSATPTGAPRREEWGNERCISSEEQAWNMPGTPLLIFGRRAAVGRQLIYGESIGVHGKFKLDA